MAKMRIFEIARSIQAKNNEIKSGDLVKLLNENGFDEQTAILKIKKLLFCYRHSMIRKKWKRY